MSIALIGKGAIGSYVLNSLASSKAPIAAMIVRPGQQDGINTFASVSDLPGDIHLVIDCGGHEALRTHGLDALRRGLDVVTVSIGALANAELETKLTEAAQKSGATLHLASGAIGALDALRSANIGAMTSVTYTGRKPPQGWKGSPAENAIELDRLSKATAHFKGTARNAALAYPKNANVAAAVALSSLGLDNTVVELIADPNISSNIHEIKASGEFGEFTFTIAGNGLPENPKSSALAAMSVVAKVLEDRKPIRF